MHGSEREYDQAGVELIGDASLRADAEVIALLGEALARCGLLGADIDIGHVGFVEGFVAELPEEARGAVLQSARAGDLVATVALSRAAGMTAERVTALERGLRYRSGGLAGARAGAPAASLRALDTLDALGPLLDAAGQEIRRARVIDEAHVEYEGVARAIEAAIAVLTGGRPR